MSDRLNKSSLSVGSSWPLFAENIAFEESDNNINRRFGNMSDTARLHSTDSTLFGRCPARSYLQLITCKLCQKVVVAPALYKHYELKHDKLLGSVKSSPPKRTIPAKRNAIHGSHSSLSFSKSKVLKASERKQVIRIEEVDPNDTSVKIEEVPLPIPSTTSKSRKVNLKSFDFKNVTVQDDRVLSPSGSTQTTVKGFSKKHSHAKEKEYDPEKHCGVWMPDIQRNCTRSITCKAHSLSLRRNVIGRSKDFDVLLAEHRAKINLKSNDNSIASPPTAPIISITPIQSPYSHEKPTSSLLSTTTSTNYRKDSATMKSSHRSTSISALASPDVFRSTTAPNLTSPDAFRSAPVMLNCISDDMRNVGSVPTIPRHPKPITTNKYGARQTDCKCRTFSRKMDHFRNASAAMLNRYKSLHHPPRLKPTLQDSLKNQAEGGIFAAIQDPLQNGIIHKQINNLKTTKMLKNTGSKRHLSLNDLQNQALLPETFNVSSISKRRHSAIIDSTSVSPNQYLNRSISNESFDKLNKVNEFLKPSSETPTNLILRRTKSVNAFPNSSFEITSSPGYVLQSQKPPTAIHSTNTVVLSPTKQTAAESKTLSPAPNITITQGMLVSLPPTLFQQTPTVQQNTSFPMNPQSKDISLVSCSSAGLPPQLLPSTKQSKHASHKQKEQDATASQVMISQPNGLSAPNTPTTPIMKSQAYNTTKLSLSDSQQRLAPNVTVTASHSLSGVLHAVTVCGANVRLKSPSFKNVNNMINDHRSHLIQQQLIMPMQSHHLAREHAEKVSLISPTNQPQVIPQLQANYTALPVEQANSTQNINMTISPQQPTANQACRKLLTQQGVAQQIQLQNQHFVSLHGGYQQQILPKLPTVPQVVPQYHNQQFAPAQNQRNVQYIAQGSSANSLPQHEGTLT